MQYSFSPQQPPANPVAAFFRATNLTFAVYDTRRGLCEGEEAEKVLSFFPTIAPINVRTSIVGLAQAVTSFAVTLSQDGSRFKSMVADHNKWVMYECEPSIWLLAIVRKAWAGSTCTNAAFKNLLISTYDVFVLLHGRMTTLLEQDPTGFALRRVLQPLLDEMGFRLLRPEAAASREAAGHLGLLANPLGPHCPGAVPLLTTSHQTFLTVQCLVNQLLVASFYGSRLVSGVLVLWGGMPVWSTLGSEDTAALVTLAARALAPAAKAVQRSRPVGVGSSLAVAARGGVGGSATAAPGSGGETAFETLLSPLQWRAGGGIQPPTTSPASSSLASVVAGLGLAFTAANGGGGAGSGTTAASGGGGRGGGYGGAAAIFGPSTLAGISLTGILGFGVGGGSSAATAAASSPGPPASGSGTPPLPVSSSAAAGPSSFSSSSTGAAAGGGGGGVGGGSSGGGVTVSGVGAPLPPFLSSFLRPRLRPSFYTSAATSSGLPLEAVLPMANVWLRGTNEWAQLLPYHRGQLLVLSLLHDGPPPGTEVLAALAAVLGRGAGPAASALAAEVPARSIWHEKGNRYCYTDSLCHVTRYSPLKKVLTLSSSAMRHLAHLRSKMDEWDDGSSAYINGGKAPREGRGDGGGEDGGGRSPGRPQRAEGEEEGNVQRPDGKPTAPAPANTADQTEGMIAAAAATDDDDDAGGGRSSSGDCELVVRTAHDAWLILRAAPGGRRLYAASEQSTLADLALTQGLETQTLPAAVVSTDALCDRLFPGLFLQP